MGHNSETAPRVCIPARAAGELYFLVVFEVNSNERLFLLPTYQVTWQGQKIEIDLTLKIMH